MCFFIQSRGKFTTNFSPMQIFCNFFLQKRAIFAQKVNETFSRHSRDCILSQFRYKGTLNILGFANFFAKKMQ